MSGHLLCFLLACWCVHDCCDCALAVRCWAADGMLPALKKRNERKHLFIEQIYSFYVKINIPILCLFLDYSLWTFVLHADKFPPCYVNIPWWCMWKIESAVLHKDVLQLLLHNHNFHNINFHCLLIINYLGWNIFFYLIDVVSLIYSRISTFSFMMADGQCVSSKWYVSCIVRDVYLAYDRTVEHILPLCWR